MKKLLLLSILVGASPQALAGGGFAGATELTQILNNVQLAESYAQQILQYENQLLGYQTMLKNLAAHPLGNISPELYKLVGNSAKVISASRDIGSNMATVDKNFADQFNSPLAKSFAERFKGWTTNSNASLKASMLNAGLQRENFKTDEDALAALVNKNQASDGNLGALKTLGEINAAQVQEMQKLRDLISQQQIAENTYMASQAAKQQEIKERNEKIMTFKKMDMPTNK